MDNTVSAIDRKLETCEYPFRWKLREKLAVSPNKAIDSLRKQLCEDSVLEVQLPFS